LICKGLDNCRHIPEDCLEEIKRVFAAKTTSIKVGNSRGGRPLA
jgi:hypothetical protein